MISSWLSKTDSNKVYVLYESLTTWKHVLLAIVNIDTGYVEVKSGQNVTDRETISEFRTSAFSGVGDYVEIKNVGCDAALIGHGSDILSNNQHHDDVETMCLHIEAMDYDYQIVDATKYSIDEIVELAQVCYYSNFKGGDNKGDYYCGITNDLDIRMDVHRHNDFSIVDDKVYAWNCCTAIVAAEVEKRLGNLGFDIGDTETIGNGGVESSCIVYLLKKGEKVNKKSS